MIAVAALPAGAIGCSSGQAPALRWTGRAAYLYGPIRGRLQTPSGGRPGTTSHARPTLSELGINRASMVDVAGAARWDQHEVYGGYRILRLSNTAVLDHTLISQGRTFPAGTEVDASVGLDWWRAGYRHWFNFDLPGNALGNLELAPGAGVAVWNFDYTLNAAGLPKVHRHYIRPSPQLSLEAEYPIGSRLSLTGSVLASVPIGNQPLIYSGELGGRYRLLERGGFEIDAQLGIGFDRIEYSSRNQRIPNDISIDAGPLLIGGLVVRF